MHRESSHQPRLYQSSHQINIPTGSLRKIESMNQTVIKKISNFSYNLSDKIGLGLTSQVFKGKNDLTGKQVAVKVIDLKSNQDRLSQQLLNEEIVTLQKIKNIHTKHLLSLEGVIQSSNNLYLITEFCEGKDMLKILKQKKVLYENQAQTVMQQLIWGYQELYSIGIIHRDLKLSNLFVSYGKLKLADFGFAIREDKCNLSLGYNVGSPKYMPPECLKYNKYSFKGDAWAMGVIAYELVYGYAPWKEKVEAKLYDEILNHPIQYLFDPNVKISDQYKSFIVQCLQVDLQKRIGHEKVFAHPWPKAQKYVDGFEEEVKKPPEVIKVPGNSYAVFKNSSNEVSYETKKMQAHDFPISQSLPSQAAIVSQLQYCKFLVNLYSHLKSTGDPSFRTLMNEIALTILIKMKVMGDIAVVSKNRFLTNDFEAYVKSPEWQNLKQVIIRYDIEFRKQLEGEPPARKNSVIPRTPLLPQTISTLKGQLPNNWRIIDKLLTYLEIREIDTASSPLEFSQKVNINAAVKDVEIADNRLNPQIMMKRVYERLEAMKF